MSKGTYLMIRELCRSTAREKSCSCGTIRFTATVNDHNEFIHVKVWHKPECPALEDA